MTKKITPAFLCEKDCATFLGMSPNWLRKCRDNGTGPNFKKFGGSIRYPIKDLEKYIEESPGGFPDHH